MYYSRYCLDSKILENIINKLQYLLQHISLTVQREEIQMKNRKQFAKPIRLSARYWCHLRIPRTVYRLGDKNARFLTTNFQYLYRRWAKAMLLTHTKRKYTKA